MKKLIPCCVVAVAVMAWVPSASAETWKGKVSDGMCGAKHGSGEHAGGKTTDRECVEKCVKGGEKYAFVADSKVFKIANQDFAGLKTHAGHEVVLTGDMKGDTITVTKIDMPKAEAPKQ
jgi:hypothetical protein